MKMIRTIKSDDIEVFNDIKITWPRGFGVLGFILLIKE